MSTSNEDLPVNVEDLAPGAELRRLMRQWRQRLDPGSIPGLTAGSRPRRRKVSQEELAHLVGVTVQWYWRLESGECRAYGDDFLDNVAYALRLDPHERTVLYLLAAGRTPPPTVRPAVPTISAGMRRTIDELPFPAWISDAGWDMLVHNNAAMQWFPHFAYERNIMRWTYMYPQSRLQLCEWDTTWAPRMLAQMRAALARWPNNKRLSQILSEALRHNPEARRMWSASPEVQVHPDGDRRRLYRPHIEEPVEIEILAWTPMRDDALRTVILVPTEHSPMG